MTTGKRDAHQIRTFGFSGNPANTISNRFRTSAAHESPDPYVLRTAISTEKNSSNTKRVPDSIIERFEISQLGEAVEP